MIKPSNFLKNVFLFIVAMVFILLFTKWIFPQIVWRMPLFFVSVPFFIFLLFAYLYPKKSATLKFSNIDNLKDISPSWRVKIFFLLPLLKIIALSFFVFALARPQIGNQNTKISTHGIAIMMVIDVSDSMRALDFADEKNKNRLDVVKNVFQEFVGGHGKMVGRKNDLIGLIAFGGYAESKCPLTLDHDALLNVLKKQVNIPKPMYDAEGNIINGEEFQTAIGDAIAIGVERLKNHPVKSKVMILLTDGENTAGILDPLDGAQIAQQQKIKIYTIGVGSNGVVPFPVKNMFGEEVLRGVKVKMDEELLKKIADTTGGKYYNASNKEGLKNIYEKIDTLERQEINVDFLEYEELYILFLIPGFFLILLEKLLSSTIIRKMP